MANAGFMAKTTEAHLLLLNIRVKDKNRSTFGTDFLRRLDALEAANKQALSRAAADAERISKDRAKALRPPAPSRKGRSNKPGALADNINWRVVDGNVVLDRKRLDQRVKWWVVQEIGTNKKAAVKVGGQKRTAGRPSKAATNAPGGKFVSVRSQKGRRIPGHLAFGTGPGGNWVAPSANNKNQQLFLMAKLKGAPLGPLRAGATAVQDLRIREEIKPKGFIRVGAREGFRGYRNDVVAAARATLAKRKP